MTAGQKSLIAATLLAATTAATAQEIKPSDGKARKHGTELKLTETLSHSWSGQLVTYELSFPASQATLNSIRVLDVDNGREIPFQLSAQEFHDPGETWAKSVKVSFFVDKLPANGSRTYRVVWDPGSFATAQATHPSLKSAVAGENLEVGNGLWAIRLPAGEKRFEEPANATGVAGPVRGIKGPDGAWRATSAFHTPRKVLGWKTGKLETGPLWESWRTRFDFEDGLWFEMDIKVMAGLSYAYVTERNNFPLRLEQIYSPLYPPNGQMPHGDAYICWGVADQLRILMKENFDPDIAFSPKTFSWGYAQDPMKHDKTRVWTAIRPVFPSVDGAWLGAFSTDNRKNDMVLIVGRAAAEWEYPDSSTHPLHTTPGVNAEIHFVDEPGEHAYFRIPMARALRHWLLGVGDKRDWTELRYTAHPNPSMESALAPYPAHLRASVCDLPLNKIKDWHLDWKQKLPGRPVFSPGTGTSRGLGTIPVNTGGQMRDLLLHIGYAGFVQSISIVRPQASIAEAADNSAASLDPEISAPGRRELAFITSVVTDGDYWQYAWNPGRSSYLPNFGSDLYIAVGLSALVLPDHPNSKAWMAFTLEELDKEFRYYYSTDGAPEENVGSYAVWTWGQLGRLLPALKKAGILDMGKDPRYQAACRFWLEVLTPPKLPLADYAAPEPIDKRLRGFTPYGDHGANNRTFPFHHLNVPMLKDANPRLAAESAWAAEQSTGKGVDGVASVTPELRSRRIRGLGAVLRNHFPSDKETFLAIKSSRIYSHHHADEGAVHIYLRGVPVALQALNPQRNNLITFEKGPAMRRGDVSSFSASPLADSVVAEIPPGSFLPGTERPDATANGWRRHILLVKSPTPSVPDYFVFYDKVFGPESSRFNLSVFSPKPQPGTGATANWLLLPPIDSPNHGVAGDLVFMAPASPKFAIEPIIHKDLADAPLGWAVQADQPAGRDWLWLLYGREGGMERPRIEIIQEPHAFKLTSPGGEAVDYVVCAAGPVSARTDEFRFTGRSGVARLKDGLVTAVLVDGVEIRLNEIGAFGLGTIYLEQDPDGFTGFAEGPEQEAYLFLGAEWTSKVRLTLNGKTETLNSPNGILFISLSAGRSEFRIERSE